MPPLREDGVCPFACCVLAPLRGGVFVVYKTCCACRCCVNICICRLQVVCLAPVFACMLYVDVCAKRLPILMGIRCGNMAGLRCGPVR